MRRSQDALKKLRSLELVTESTMQMTVNGAPTRMTTTTQQAFLNPGKTRTEATTPSGAVLVVSDGETTWVYESAAHQFTRRSAALGPAAIASSMGLHLPDLSQVKVRSKTLREETIELAGQKHPCWVVQHTMEVPPLNGPEGPQTSAIDALEWIDQKLALGLRRQFSFSLTMPGASTPVAVSQTLITTSLKIDQPLPDSLFTFSPPSDAKEVAEILNVPNAPQADLPGKSSPPFSVKSLDAATYSNSSLANKPVLLDFWATWCGPCHKSMPALEKLSAEYRNQGLVVLGINAGEDRDTVEAFLRTSPIPYPVVLGAESDILAAFHVTAYPTFVLIGKDSKIAAHQIGFGGESSLRAMLEKAGLTPSK